ncbi:hypothetical protein [Hydrogenoanaerobacterium sp.]|uniref:hypothetical protein n=1 Tax=Hydrogenoanaerobacterium sp. TaxID=2953763 RepID=UPI00289B6E20|nr:hypothetical protein [Hydrogenoanaerobacterium sp.]
MQFILSTVISFLGLGVAFAVLITNTLYIKQTKHKFSALLYMSISLVYGFALITSLVRQSSGIACAMTPQSTLVIYGGLVLLHLYFLWDTLKSSKEKNEP